MIRAFKSSLEEMEDARSCHSMHSVRSTRSYLANSTSRPTSDISYIDDDEKGKKNANGHYRGGTACHRNSGGGGGSCTKSSTEYLKVEGGAYRVQRSVSSGSGSLSQGTGVRRDQAPGASNKQAPQSTDAATQSVESTFTQTDETCLGPQMAVMGAPPLAPSSPLPPLYIEAPPGLEYAGRVGSSLGQHPQLAYTRGTSPTPPQFNQYNPHQYHPPPFPYDPNYYHTYLNPMVSAGMDMGYQYDIVVRRPSMGGAEVGLSVPIPNPSDPNLRRPSMGSSSGAVTTQSHFVHHPPHLSAPHSLPGSFDSQAGPPATPQYNPTQPLSPRHLHNPSTSPMVTQNQQLAGSLPNNNVQTSSSSPTPPSDPSSDITSIGPASVAPAAVLASKPIPIPATDIPKLIHETSI